MADLFDVGVEEVEEDPASDFLARERDELAGLDDDFGGLKVESAEVPEAAAAAVVAAEAVADPPTVAESNSALLDDDFGLGESAFWGGDDRIFESTIITI